MPIHKPEVYNREKALSHMRKHGLETKYLGKWVGKLMALRGNAKTRGAECHLTLSQYVKLAIKAGISKPNQVGRKAGQFQMGRYGDTGDYEWGNCRFIPREQNTEERRINGGDLAGGVKNSLRTKKNSEGRRSQSEKISKQFILRSPDGKLHKGKNLGEFAKLHDLRPNILSLVCRGIRLHHKGWTGRYA